MCAFITEKNKMKGSRGPQSILLGNQERICVRKTCTLLWLCDIQQVVNTLSFTCMLGVLLNVK